MLSALASRGQARAQPYRRVMDIPPPPGFARPSLPPNSFGYWLRRLDLRSDPVVYLYDGRPKPNQGAQVAVLAVPVGTRDLQQCADACMRLRAEYLLSQGRIGEIEFRDNLGRRYRLERYAGRDGFERYLEKVYSHCGTASLEKQLLRIHENERVEPGDVVIRGGAPGHAVMVVDVAEDREGRRRYLLAQSYMPAQMIHILRNPADLQQGPWYRLRAGEDIRTPEWTFTNASIRRW